MELMNGRELEIYLGGKLSYWTLLELAKTGELPILELGGGCFFAEKPLTRG